jgi:hypothetical protein
VNKKNQKNFLNLGLWRSRIPAQGNKIFGVRTGGQPRAPQPFEKSHLFA